MFVEMVWLIAECMSLVDMNQSARWLFPSWAIVTMSCYKRKRTICGW